MLQKHKLFIYQLKISIQRNAELSPVRAVSCLSVPTARGSVYFPSCLTEDCIEPVLQQMGQTGHGVPQR